MRLFLRNYSHMAAITQRLLRRPVRCRELRQFSSSSDSDPPPHPPGDSQPKTEPAPSFSSYIKDVSAQLENRPRKFSFSNRPLYGPQRQSTDFEQIHKSLAEFRIHSAAPPPSSGPGQHGSFDIIRENLRTKSPPAPGIRGGNRSDVSDPLSIARLTENLKPNPDQNPDQGKTLVMGGSNSMPYFLTKGMKGGQDNAEDRSEGMRTALVKSYDCKELGEELKKLRPEKRKGKWFSLNELNERLAKLNEITVKNPKNALGVMFDIRGVLADQAKKEVQDKKKKSSYRLDILSSIGGTPKYMLKAPKENLVEKYYHPDNMSSAEKLKIELQRVRDEFKMSESDCGSARVQVAQLTTKIKHLSNVLSKKDKHSRKGLQDMVQRRKKLLKYLSRTDWDSYCLVRSKLGLRDNPDIKA